ncbi:hypothetical protein B6U84_00145 [Candidatus Bathyarchaeota archaeon ex4484_40]|nr:MAG: hypothetical protein B6U84_00145 [Candidatus Bathyarchaeota archaeon ex4484_40]
MEKNVDLLVRVLSPYVDRLVEALFTADIDLEEASIESFAEFLCFRIELTVRQMVRELNWKMRRGELEALRQLIRDNPKAARKASRYVAKRLKYRIRRLIEEELNRTDE